MEQTKDVAFMATYQKWNFHLLEKKDACSFALVL